MKRGAIKIELRLYLNLAQASVVQLCKHCNVIIEGVLCHAFSSSRSALLEHSGCNNLTESTADRRGDKAQSKGAFKK